LELPTKIWAEVSMDFIDGLPKSDGYTVIMVVVDRLSKYAHFIPMRHPYAAITVAAAFLREIIRLHGIPESIVSDRDKIFLSNFWKELFKLQGTQLKYSTAYHPQTDGQTEVVNRCIETYLRLLRIQILLSNGLVGFHGVIARIGKVAYKLQLPDTTSIHPVFHVSQLKMARGVDSASSNLPATLTEDMEIIPEQVEGIRGGASEAEKEILIKWKDLPGYESTWEPFVTIKKQFPEFHLEDKVAVWEGSIGKDRFKEVYQRRERKNYRGGNAS
nr:putative mitochondrial protein [Tanacetum cinerariifolium]